MSNEKKGPGQEQKIREDQQARLNYAFWLAREICNSGSALTALGYLPEAIGELCHRIADDIFDRNHRQLEDRLSEVRARASVVALETIPPTRQG